MDKRSTWLVLGAFVAVLGTFAFTRVILGRGISPVEIVAGLLALGVLLAVLARHPAAFITPMLFAPRDSGLPFFQSQYGLDQIKALDVLAALVVFAMLVRLLLPSHRLRLAPGGWRDRRGGILAYFLFAVVIAFSYLYTLAPNYGGSELWQFLLFGSLAFFAPFLLVQSEEDVRDFTIGSVVFGMGTAIASLRFSHQGSISAAEHISHIGEGQVIGLAILLLLFQPVTNKRIRALTLIGCMPLLAIGLPSADARGPLFSVLIALLFYLVMPGTAANAIPRKQLALVIGGLAAAVFVISAFWFQSRGAAASRLRAKSSELTEIFTGSVQVEGTAVERLDYYKAAPAEFFRHPILGLGVGGWSMDYFHQDTKEYPHNLIVEVAVEQGALGLMVLAFFIGTVYLAFKRNTAKAATALPALFPALIYLFSLTMFSGDLLDDRFLWFWCGLVLAASGIALTSPSAAEQEIEGDESSVPA